MQKLILKCAEMNDSTAFTLIHARICEMFRLKLQPFFTVDQAIAIVKQHMAECDSWSLNPKTAARYGFLIAGDKIFLASYNKFDQIPLIADGQMAIVKEITHIYNNDFIFRIKKIVEISIMAKIFTTTHDIQSDLEVSLIPPHLTHLLLPVSLVCAYIALHQDSEQNKKHKIYEYLQKKWPNENILISKAQQLFITNSSFYSRQENMDLSISSFVE